MLSVPSLVRISFCLVQYLRFLSNNPLTTPQVNGAGSSRSAKATAPQKPAIANL